ncbi:MAG: 30S ribosome-binding factor RbfA [Alphaproteobacteria bacterium]|nr:30S ribosome-binding factor RbfA [Alphaproteobacteria bacterium]
MRRKQTSKSKINEPSQRQLRVGEQIRHILSETLQRGHFSNTLLLNHSNTITISEVRPSPDLKYATAYIIPLGGGGDNLQETLDALNAESRVFQKDIGTSLSTKFTPRIKFVEDDSFANAAHIENILRDIHSKDR